MLYVHADAKKFSSFKIPTQLFLTFHPWSSEQPHEAVCNGCVDRVALGEMPQG